MPNLPFSKHVATAPAFKAVGNKGLGLGFRGLGFKGLGLRGLEIFRMPELSPQNLIDV